MKTVVIFIGLLLYSSAAFGQLHVPTWTLISDQNMSSFDMLTTRTGLVAINYNGVRTLMKYDSATLSGLYAPSGAITSIIIRDENIAYFSVKGDGIYEASNGWKDYSPLVKNSNTFLLCELGTNVLANIGLKLNYCTDGFNFLPSGGFAPTDTVLAASYLTPQIAIAVTSHVIYRTTDGGSNWTPVSSGGGSWNSVYADRTNNIVFTGGSKVLRSLDAGKTWDTVTSIFFTLAGALVGSRDCSGTFYVGPDGKTHGTDLYRSSDHGRFFQQAGPAMFSSIRMMKGVVLDRGSTFFYLDSSGLLGVVRDGIDSVITDSVRNRVNILADTGVHNSLCANSTPTAFGVHVSFDQCTGIVLDSLKQIVHSTSFSAILAQDTLRDTTISISFTFHANRVGMDTAHYRLKFHSPITGNIEQVFFDVSGTGTIGSPELGTSASEIDFEKTGLDSIRTESLTVTNPGCDTLYVDTIFSTSPDIFSIDAKTYPLMISGGKNATIHVSFSPHQAGDYLESLQFETNAGNRFVALRGTGKAPHAGGVRANVASSTISISPNPANTHLRITSQAPLPRTIRLLNILGKEVASWHTDQSFSMSCDIRFASEGYYIVDLGGEQFEHIRIEH